MSRTAPSMDGPRVPGRGLDPSSPLGRSRPRPGGSLRPSRPGSGVAPPPSATIGAAGVGWGGGGAIEGGEGCPLGTAVRSSSGRRIIGPFLRISDGGPTLIRSLVDEGGGVGGTGTAGRVAAGGGGVGRRVGGRAWRSWAGGGRKTRAFRSSEAGSNSSIFRGLGSRLISIISIVTWTMAETRNPWRWFTRFTGPPTPRLRDPTT